MTRTLLFDTETNGLIKNSVLRLEQQPRVIEWFGLMLDQDDNEVDKWESLFAHPKPLPKIIIEVTGIDNELLKDAPQFRQKADELQAFIESADRVVGHNLAFDIEMTDNEFSMVGKKITWPMDRICTVEATEYMKGYRQKLGDLYEFLFNKRFPNAHRAENDVRAMTEIYIGLKQKGDV